MGPMAPKDWLIPERETERERELVHGLGVSPLVAHLLRRLGYEEAEEAKSFLEPKLGDLLDPAGLPNMGAATDRLEAAIAAGEKILLFGDYDVDGITGASVLFLTLGALGAEVEVHIPDRSEGYGINTERLARAADEGVRVVVSIDNGIAAIDEAAFLAERGLDLIVADHHTMGDTLPQACALVHPRMEGSTYDNPHLCGAGVAFKLAWSIAGRLGREGRASPKLRQVLVQCMALVALGTVADVVQLVGENRVLVRHGLKVLAALRDDPECPLPGLKALCSIARLMEEAELDTTHVAFRIAPRLNAAGRMGEARRAFRLLTTSNADEAEALAQELDGENRRRRELQARVFKEAEQQVRDVYGETPPAGIVAWGPSWPHGVVGIVAAKLTETFHRPALVASVEGERAKGSGRSLAGVDLLASLEANGELFVRHGGHAAAVGFTIDCERLQELREAFPRGVKASLGLGADAEQREIDARLEGYEVVSDAEVDLDEVSRDLIEDLAKLSPFGAGNPEPLFTAREVILAGEPRLMGKTGQHVSFMLRQGERVFRTVAFGRPDVWELLRERARPGPDGAQTFEVAFRPRLNRWKGTAKVELELQAIRFPGPPG